MMSIYWIDLIWKLYISLSNYHITIETIYKTVIFSKILTLKRLHRLPVVVRYSVLPIYRGRVYRGIGYIVVACWTPIFFGPPILRIVQTWRPRARYFLPNRSNSLHPIRRRHFFAKSAHRESLCSHSQESIFREINSSLPVNTGWNTCYAIFTSFSQQIRQPLCVHHDLLLAARICLHLSQRLACIMERSVVVIWFL